MEIVNRPGWAALRPRDQSHFKKPEAIFLHHTTGATLGADLSDDWVRNIQIFHMNVKLWDDIGYSFLFDAFGRVFEGRGWNVVGAHTPGWNSRAHAFAYMGSGDSELPATAQEALRYLVAESDRKFGRLPIMGHRQAKATHCPGDWIFNHREQFRDGAVPPPAPQPPPTPPPAPTAPPFPGRLLRLTRPLMRGEDVRTWQAKMAQRGWRIGVDGWYGPQSADVCRKFQAEKQLGVDGVVGPITWTATWTAAVT